MKACKLVINDKYLYSGGAINTEVIYAGYYGKGYMFQYADGSGFLSLLGLGVRAFIWPTDFKL
jgi:hypothetical protein